MKQLDNIAVAMWTHSSYADIWPMYFGQLEQHAPFLKKYCIINEPSNSIPASCAQIVNTESDPYYRRFVESISQIQEEYIVYMQEDFILYGDVSPSSISKIKEFLEDSPYSFVRLIKSGVEGGEQVLETPPVYEIPHSCGGARAGNFDLRHSPEIYPQGGHDRPYIFSYQATIWKKQSLLNLFNFFKPKSLMEGELYGSYACLNTNTRGCYAYGGEEKRSNLHYDSDLFPFISTALHGGSHGRPAKWVLSAYPKELGNLLKKYSIDPNERGIL